MKFFATLVFILLLHSCAPDNVTVDKSIGAYFKEAGTDGCFALLDNSDGEFTVYNLRRYRDSAFVPGATFDLVTALVGLQTGAIVSDTAALRNYTAPPVAAGSNATMYNAFRTSATPYFQEIARRIGRDTLQHFLDTLSYGTKKIKTALDSFWLTGSLRLTPDEQLGFVKRLYFGQLPFFKVNQELVKHAMLQEQNSAYTLAYKTTPGVWDTAHKKNIGWIVGWVEKDRQPRFFVALLESDNASLDMPAAGIALTRKSLQHLGFLPGKQ